MLSLNLTRWIIGSVRFSVIGGSPERFFSLSARSGAYLWDISGAPESGACVAARRYRYLRRNARRSGCRLRVQERHGLPFLLARTKKHPGLWVGAALFLAVLYVLSFQIWCIRISGCESVPPAELENALASVGLTQGMWKKDLAAEKLAQKMLLQFPEFRWMSINTYGCVAQVEVREKTERPEISDQKTACNIKASATGQIISMQVFAGTPAVRKGDAVVEGQLLVSGIVVDQSGGSTMLHASAQVIAETQRTMTAEVDLSRIRYDPTGRTAVRRNLDLFGLKLPLSLETRPKGEFELSCEKTELQLFGTLLPVGVYTECWTEMRSVGYMLTRDQAVALAREEVRSRTSANMISGTIMSEKDEERWSGEKLIYTAALTCRENIAEESEIFIK